MRNNFTLNLIALKPDAFDAIREADEKLIGTLAYMGVAWFWNNAYKHNLRGDIRPISYATRRRIHKAWLKAGLAVDGESPAHEAILFGIIPRK
jgi:hypothetical protein